MTEGNFFCGKTTVHPPHEWIYADKHFWCIGVAQVHPKERRPYQ